MHNDLAVHLRKWGLTVVEDVGWQTRGSSSFDPRGIIVHHTAGSASGNAPSLGIVRNGRPGIPGPLSQFVLGRDGRVYLVGSGRANHAGVGGAVAGIPRNAGNSQCWGIEAENTGVGEAWRFEQLQAYYRLCAALCDYSDIPVSRIIAHREWATPTGRKADPAGIEMNSFREKVAQALVIGPVTASGDSILSLGDRGPAVLELQNLLWEIGYRDAGRDSIFGPGTQKVVVDFQVKNSLAADGIVGKNTWSALRGKVAPTPPAEPSFPVVTEKFVRFGGFPEVYEVMGSRLYHVTGHAWKARGLGAQNVQILAADHPVAGLTKVMEV